MDLKRVPALRFEGFTGDWEEKILDELVDFLDERRIPLSTADRQNKKGEYPYYGASGIIDYVDDYIFDEDLVLLSEDGANLLDRNYRICFIAKGKYWVNNHAHVLRVNNNNIQYFICEILEMLNIEKYNTGSAQPKLNQTIARQLPCVIPQKAEQQKIADFFTLLDKKIETHEKLVYNWEKKKKGYMQKIFSQELRFYDDNGKPYPEWEEKRFEDVFSYISTNTLSREKMNYEDLTEYYNIHYGDIHTKYSTMLNVATTEIPNINPAEIKKNIDDGLCKESDLIIADTSEDYADIGKSIEVINIDKKLVSGLHTYLCRENYDCFVNCYKGYMMESHTVKNQIKILAAGIKVLSINKKNLNTVLLSIPQKEEQQKIADFLSAIDEKIEMEKEVLEYWKQVKKGYMQKMFV